MTFHVESFEQGERIGLQEVKDIETEILVYFADYCREHDLRFFLAGGTLLGAIRHQGFVPWDDDIDIVMPRPDWEIFMKNNTTKFGPYELRSFQYTPEVHPRPLFRIVNPRYFMKIDHIQKFLPIWIDILPLDGLPEDKEERKQHYRKAKKLKWLIARSYSNFYKEKNPLKRVLKLAICLPLRMIGPTYFIKKLDELGKKYDYEEAPYAGSFVAGYGYREGVVKSVFESSIDASFEGHKFPIPAGYDTVLKSVYGNYMKLPPASKRKKHLLGAWENAAFQAREEL